ncbi:hypothetical protein [Marinobacter mangrovi]|uniref:hypothetical protein n=1 Tax=Marinobacter mangrovi TaxID=2803918 RepID=UPI00193361FF|nr:hypothetical protein [Marinobacter mangrovi]
MEAVELPQACRRIIATVLSILLAFISFTAHADNWALDCHSGLGRVEFSDPHHATLVVSSNQITISSNVILADGTYSFFYAEPEDLGRGGMMLKWDSFSKKNPIATGKLLEDGGMLFTWNGFYDSVAESDIWADDADYVLQTNQHTMNLEHCGD